MESNYQKTIARILKVNHAGEYGAIRIYSAQLLLSKYLYKDLAGFLEEVLEHEKGHYHKFTKYMSSRCVQPCKMKILWGIGGYMLGIMTALTGRNAIMVCTQAVESTVHKHLNDQIIFLRDKDRALQRVIKAIEKQEIAHLTYAKERVNMDNIFSRALYYLVCLSTHIIIWLSTWGDVSRMEKTIKYHSLP